MTEIKVNTDYSHGLNYPAGYFQVWKLPDTDHN